jgi:hypothetical protein
MRRKLGAVWPSALYEASLRFEFIHAVGAIHARVNDSRPLFPRPLFPVGLFHPKRLEGSGVHPPTGRINRDAGRFKPGLIAGTMPPEV